MVPDATLEMYTLEGDGDDYDDDDDADDIDDEGVKDDDSIMIFLQQAINRQDIRVYAPLFQFG